jgi:hypothetical protein
MASLSHQEAISPHEDGAPQGHLSLRGPRVEQKDQVLLHSILTGTITATDNAHIRRYSTFPAFKSSL